MPGGAGTPRFRETGGCSSRRYEFSARGRSVPRVREGVKDRINNGYEGRALMRIPGHNTGRIAGSCDLLQFGQFPTQRLQPKRSPHFRFFRHSTLRVSGAARRKLGWRNILPELLIQGCRGIAECPACPAGRAPGGQRGGRPSAASRGLPPFIRERPGRWSGVITSTPFSPTALT